MPTICFALTPSWAWELSGNMNWAPSGDWDLWQARWGSLQDPDILPAWGDSQLHGIYEVRSTHRIYKRDLWLVGSRTKGGHR